MKKPRDSHQEEPTSLALSCHVSWLVKASLLHDAAHGTAALFSIDILLSLKA